MDLESALEKLNSDFPFTQLYSEAGACRESYLNVARQVIELLPVGSKILDFGSGPCDKTAVLQWVGFKCSACDDLCDDWHLQDNNRDKIIRFAQKNGIDFRLIHNNTLPVFEPGYFDMIMLNDVLEHLHHSPRELLKQLLTFLRPEGILLITVPNAVNIRKRIDVLRGKTNLPPFESFFNSTGPWRGHIREYVEDDLRQLAIFLNLKIIKLTGCDQMITKVPAKLRWLYLKITNFFPGLKDTWLLAARKPRKQ